MTWTQEGKLRLPEAQYIRLDPDCAGSLTDFQGMLDTRRLTVAHHAGRHFAPIPLRLGIRFHYEGDFLPSSTLSFSSWLGLKESTDRESIVIGSPVCGFRPRRARLWLTTKVPKPEIFTFSPSRSLSVTIAKTSSTISPASFFERPIRS